MGLRSAKGAPPAPRKAKRTSERPRVQYGDFDETNLMDGNVMVRVQWSCLNYKEGFAAAYCGGCAGPGDFTPCRFGAARERS
jgi:hypothetical protein